VADDITKKAPAAGTTQYLWDVMRGADDPEGVSDYLRGLVFGPKRKK